MTNSFQGEEEESEKLMENASGFDGESTSANEYDGITAKNTEKRTYGRQNPVQADCFTIWNRLDGKIAK